MKITGFLIMPAGWIIVLTALMLLRPSVVQNVFIASGIGVEALGFILFTRSHLEAKGGNE